MNPDLSPSEKRMKRRRRSKKGGEDEIQSDQKKTLPESQNQSKSKKKSRTPTPTLPQQQTQSKALSPSSPYKQTQSSAQHPSKSPKTDKKRMRNENQGEDEKADKGYGAKKAKKKTDEKNKQKVQENLIVEIRGFDDELFNDVSDDGSEHDEDVEYPTDEEIYFNLVEIFGDCGSILRIDIPINDQTKKRSGHAIMEFKEEQGWRNALAKNGNKMLKKTISVSEINE